MNEKETLTFTISWPFNQLQPREQRFLRLTVILGVAFVEFQWFLCVLSQLSVFPLSLNWTIFLNQTALVRLYACVLSSGYPPTPTSPGNSSTQSGALLGDTVMTGDSSVAITTTLTTAAPPVTMATNASSYGNGWQRNDGSSVGARAPNDVAFNGHRQQTRVSLPRDALGLTINVFI
jgi:hypothetical protein